MSVLRISKTPKLIFTYSNGVVCCVENRNPIALIFWEICRFDFYAIYIYMYICNHFPIERSIYMPIMGAGDSRSQACSSCASHHWAYRNQQVTLVTTGLACVPNQDAGHGLVAFPG